MARPAWKIEELIASYTASANKAKTSAARRKHLEYVEFLRGELKLQRELEAKGPEQRWKQLLKDARSFGPVY